MKERYRVYGVRCKVAAKDAAVFPSSVAGRPLSKAYLQGRTGRGGRSGFDLPRSEALSLGINIY
jgi:hypothetical protein